MCTAYKIYAKILRNKIEEEIEEKEIIPENQAGFRRGRSAVDNINICITSCNTKRKKEKRKKRRRKGKVYTLFADLKADFLITSIEIYYGM